MEIWLMLPGAEGPGPGGGDGVAAEASGPKRSYSGIASINKSTRENKNVLEVRLDRSEAARFNLSMEET